MLRSKTIVGAKINSFKVLVADQFPWDMLFYEQCFPASLEDARKLGENGPRQIVMARPAALLLEPDYKMWKERGCRIEEHSTSLSSSY